MIDKLISKVPEHWNTTETSNNYQLLKAFADNLNKVDINSSLLKESIQISTATGNQLDDIGRLFNLNRDGRNDIQFRSVILGFWQARLGGGTKSSISSVIQSVFNLSTDEFTIQELDELKFIIEFKINDDVCVDCIYGRVFDNVANVKATGTSLVDVLFKSKSNSFLTNFSFINGEDLIN